MTLEMDRRTLLRRSAILGGGVAAASSPLMALGTRAARGQAPGSSPGYGPLVPKGDLMLPAEFDYVVIDHQGTPMRDGHPTPGIFDGMGAFRGRDGTTILIRNHENRERPGEIDVVVPPDKEYDPEMLGGNTKVVVRRVKGVPQRVTSFAVLGGTSTNCAGGETPWRSWITCEEVVKRGATGLKHGYIFEIPAEADGPVKAVPIKAAGRMWHEAVSWVDGVLYETEDRSIEPDAKLGALGACFYRYVPSDGDDERRRLSSRGRLQALKLRGEFHANMDTGRIVGKPYPVEWVTVPEPDHEDDTDERRDRQRGFTPTRIQAQDRGAAYFDRLEGTWVAHEGDDDDDDEGVVYFDATTGGAQNLGQLWRYDPGRRTITLVYESIDPARLENPDNLVIVPATGDVFLQEDGEDGQYVRGVTERGEIYDFARTVSNETEFCGGCFDPDGRVLYLNQQGERGGIPDGPPDGRAVTYAIFGPFDRRAGAHDDDGDDDDD